MAGIKYILQKEVFDELDEKILSVVNVNQNQKKKISYLCLNTSTRISNQITICQVKQYDKGVYKRKRTWQLDELKLVDGRNEIDEIHEFDLVLEKNYRWFAANSHERQNFITLLWKQSNKHIVANKAQFKNIPSIWLAETILAPEAPEHKNVEENDEMDAIEYEDFNALTDKEENDLNKWIKEYNYAIGNAELFIEQLTLNLNNLDGANVQSVLASEEQVTEFFHIVFPISNYIFTF